MFIMFIVGIVVGTMLLGSALALTATSFTYAKKHVGYVAVTPFDLQPAADTIGFAADYDGRTGAGCADTGLRLPQGATLVNATVYETEGISAPLVISIYRVNRATGAVSSAIGTPATDGSRQAHALPIPSTWAKVNNATFDYMFEVCHDPDGIFHGARIKYTYESAGD
jgi:hypothetical protein